MHRPGHSSGERGVEGLAMAGDDEDVFVVSVTSGAIQQAWCSTCLKSAQVTVEILALGEDGFGPIGEVSGCPDCGTGVFGDDEAD
jgi:hypothetical protein